MIGPGVGAVKGDSSGAETRSDGTPPVLAAGRITWVTSAGGGVGVGAVSRVRSGSDGAPPSAGGGAAPPGGGVQLR